MISLSEASRPLLSSLAAVLEDGFQFFGRDDFELGEGAGLRRAILAPAAEVGHVAEAAALHVFVGDLNDEFGAQRFPLEVLAPAPTALSPGHAVFCGGRFFRSLPVFPGVVAESVFAIRREEGEEIAAHGCGEAGADTDVLKDLCVVVEAQEKGTDLFASGIFVPAESGDDAIAVALVFDLEHYALVGLVGEIYGLGYYAIESSAFETVEPVDGGTTVSCRRRDVDWRLGGFEQRFQFGATFLEWRGAEVPLSFAKKIEEDA